MMTTQITQIEKWNNRQRELLKFLGTTEPVRGNIIREWIAECIVHFTEVNVPQNIIAYFLTKMEHISIKGKKKLKTIYFQDDDEEEEKESFIGPFEFVGNGYLITSGNILTGKQGGHVKMTPILVAFRVAQNLIDTYKDQNNIIPKILITELEKYKDTKSLSLSLSTIQTAFEKDDIDSMLISIITSTDLILSLIPELSSTKDLKPKIQTAHDSKTIYGKYSMDPEILWSINNSRIIRNYKIHKPIKTNHTTTYEAVGYAHLLHLLISSILSSGELKLTKE